MKYICKKQSILLMSILILLISCKTSTTEPELPPNNPTNLNVYNIDYTIISLEWTDNSDNEEFFLLERGDGDSTLLSEIVELTSNTKTYIDSNLTKGSKYYYRIRAIRKGDLYSDYSNIIGVTTLISKLEITPFEEQVSYNSTYNQIISLNDFEYPIFGISFRVRYDDSIISVNDSSDFNVGNYFGNNSILFAKADSSKIFITISLTQGSDKKTGSGELCRYVSTGFAVGQTFITIQDDELYFYDEYGNTVPTPDLRIISSKVTVQ